MNYFAEILWAFVIALVLIRVLVPRAYIHAEHLMAANLITKSRHANGRDTARTFHLIFPRIILAEMNTHKSFARSVSSSRAIPVMKMLAQVWNNPFIPISFGVNIKGMQAKTEITGYARNVLENLWVFASEIVCVIVWIMVKLNLHKQTANRLLEPWLFVQATMTMSYLNNFFNLRDHPDAQPEIQHLARMMKQADLWTQAMPLAEGGWHLPWIDSEDLLPAEQWALANDLTTAQVLLRASAARCARSSYANFETEGRSIEKDMDTFHKLVFSEPAHASPAEHQLQVDEAEERMVHVKDEHGNWDTGTMVSGYKNEKLHGHTPGFIVFRNTLPNHFMVG